MIILGGKFHKDYELGCLKIIVFCNNRPKIVGVGKRWKIYEILENFSLKLQCVKRKNCWIVFEVDVR